MANKKVKGARANKPNDSFGTINNNDLYKNSQYSKDLDKDDDEVEQSEEENTGPVEETATQEKESSESFAAKKEEVDYKKRYDDLKRHYDQKIEEFKKSSAKVESEKQTLKATGNLEAFRNKYPDVYEAVEQLSSAKADSQIASLKEEIDSLKGNEKNLKKEKAYEELLRLQPDFDTLKTDEKFLEWLSQQPESISNGIYNNNTDAKWASRVVDLYKADSGSKGTRLSKKADAASSVSSPTPREISSKGGNEKVWKASEIERLKPWEFEKFEKEIDKARSEGRLDLSR
jgi:hypothetical protein